jgi:methylmalonyl-CoA/ethylmalonyl-CoA epimerase
MNDINKTIAELEFAQVGWVVPDIQASVKFFSNILGIDFPEVHRASAEELEMTYYGNIVASECLTTQTYNGGAFIELIQPLSGKSMFSDYLEKFPLGGIQHMAYRLQVAGFERVKGKLQELGYAIMSEVDHPIARMVFFDTYQTLGVATEIMGITPEGWGAIRQMERKP